MRKNVITNMHYILRLYKEEVKRFVLIRLELGFVH